jgi:hypothetical protein
MDEPVTVRVHCGTCVNFKLNDQQIQPLANALRNLLPGSLDCETEQLQEVVWCPYFCIEAFVAWCWVKWDAATRKMYNDNA